MSIEDFVVAVFVSAAIGIVAYLIAFRGRGQ